MEVKVIKANSLEEALAMIANMACADCRCVNRVPIKTEESVDLSFFINRIAEKKGWKFDKANGWLGSIAEISPVAAFNIVVREIAIYLDHKYEDHIENSEKIFAISTLDGRIHEVCKAHIKNYRNFAAFRTIEDAKFACNLMRDQLKGMFKKNAKIE